MIKTNHKPIRIIIIEDDKNQTELLEVLLGGMNYQVNSVYTGQEAIEILNRWLPDIVLLDLHLPDISGIQVAQEIRKKKNLEGLPIIMMSADFKEETVINALANGVDEFISKPIRMAELTLRLGTMLELKKKEKELKRLNMDLEVANETLNREKGILARYFSYDFVDKVLKEEISPNLGGVNLTASILFFDLRSSTQIAEKMRPEQFSVFLSEILENAMDIVFNHGGSVNKLLGDGLLATFGCPDPAEKDAENCCACARAIRDYLGRFNQENSFFKLDNLKAGIGISTGLVFAGNIGSARRMEYTVLGDPVNVASRLEALTKKARINIVDILIDGNTKQRIDGQFPLKKVKGANIRGKSEPVDIFYLD